jgi:7,8-dihydropterin-6-yl-methyl-4-(beta-D-ribofuranosyl)aminobenzene 5'-phosphate synthase
LCEGLFYVSGYIPRETDYEKGIPNHLSFVGGKWISDEEIADERYVACKVKDRGVVVVSSCSHAGIINVCHDAESKSGAPIFGVIGGLHLAGKQVEGRIHQTIKDLKEVNPSVILAGHCSGWRAKAQLAASFPDKFQPLAAGAKYVFSSQTN